MQIMHDAAAFHAKSMEGTIGTLDLLVSGGASDKSQGQAASNLGLPGLPAI